MRFQDLHSLVKDNDELKQKLVDVQTELYINMNKEIENQKEDPKTDRFEFGVLVGQFIAISEMVTGLDCDGDDKAVEAIKEVGKRVKSNKE
jgi:hypothetical protein